MLDSVKAPTVSTFGALCEVATRETSERKKTASSIRMMAL
jgi:hypothetical protein